MSHNDSTRDVSAQIMSGAMGVAVFAAQSPVVMGDIFSQFLNYEDSVDLLGKFETLSAEFCADAEKTKNDGGDTSHSKTKNAGALASMMGYTKRGLIKEAEEREIRAADRALPPVLVAQAAQQAFQNAAPVAQPSGELLAATTVIAPPVLPTSEGMWAILNENKTTMGDAEFVLGQLIFPSKILSNKLTHMLACSVVQESELRALVKDIAMHTDDAFEMAVRLMVNHEGEHKQTFKALRHVIEIKNQRKLCEFAPLTHTEIKDKFVELAKEANRKSKAATPGMVGGKRAQPDSRREPHRPFYNRPGGAGGPGGSGGFNTGLAMATDRCNKCFKFGHWAKQCRSAMNANAPYRQAHR